VKAGILLRRNDLFMAHYCGGSRLCSDASAIKENLTFGC
jgi:hypothetical protein